MVWFDSLTAPPMAYGNSWAKDWVQAKAVTCAAAAATQDPLQPTALARGSIPWAAAVEFLTHMPQHELWLRILHSNILFLLVGKSFLFLIYKKLKLSWAYSVSQVPSCFPLRYFSLYSERNWILHYWLPQVLFIAKIIANNILIIFIKCFFFFFFSFSHFKWPFTRLP